MTEPRKKEEDVADNDTVPETLIIAAKTKPGSIKFKSYHGFSSFDSNWFRSNGIRSTQSQSAGENTPEEENTREED